jgi:hypothetical protein
VANSGEQLQAIVTALEQCRATLAGNGNPETAQLVSLAILQLQMKVNGIAEAELKALCDAMTPPEAPAEGARGPKSRRRPPAPLKLVK